MKKEKYDLTGMTCANCANIISKEVSTISGVKKAKVSLALNYLQIESEDNVSSDQIISSIKNLGYGASFDNEISINKKSNELKILLIKFSISLLLTLPLWTAMILMLFNNHSSFSMFLHNPIFQLTIALIIEFGIGYKYFKDVWVGIKHKKINMSFLIVVGTLSAIGLSIYNATLNNWVTNMNDNPLYFEASATIITFVLLGKILEHVAKDNTSNAIKKLVKLIPNKAIKYIDGVEVEVDYMDIQLGDILIIKPGSYVPVDGSITEGVGYLNESMLTGESLPIEKTVGNKIVGSTLNTTTQFSMIVEQVGKDTTLHKIIEMIKDAQSSDLEIQKTVDKVATWFVPIVVLIAILTFIGWSIYDYVTGNITFSERALVTTISVLVIACPCALGLATPTAVMVGTARASQLGILFKGGNYLEKLAKLDTIIFDKTGTLTKNEMKVQTIKMFDKENESFYLQAIYEIEKQSNHPIAKSVVEYINSQETKKLDLKDVEHITSFGISAVIDSKQFNIGKPTWFELDQNIKTDISNYENLGHTVFVLWVDKVVKGFITIADELKDNAIELIAQLNALNIKTVMLTGDSKNTANAVANSIGISEVYGEVSVSGKADIVKQFQSNGKIVAMVGDGINDSVALTQADIGISMNDSIDVAIDSADILLMNTDLLEIIKAIKSSKKTLKKIKSNLFWAFIYNTIAIPLAIFGLLNPEIASLAMALSSVSVVMNSLFLNVK